VSQLPTSPLLKLTANNCFEKLFDGDAATSFIVPGRANSWEKSMAKTRSKRILAAWKKGTLQVLLQTGTLPTNLRN
jgi:hypothetical protein